MIDKNLLRLLGDNKKYIFYTVGLYSVYLPTSALPPQSAG